MASLVALTRELSGDRHFHDDSFSDRLSHRYTTTMLILFAVAVSTKQYVGDPINCWAPVHFTENHVDYTNDYCWVRNTYYLPFEDEVPKEGEDWKQHTVVYYQWVPLILIAQAFLFYLPCLMWRSMASKSGVDASSIAHNAKIIATLTADKEDGREGFYRHMVVQIHRYLSSCKREPKTKFTLSLKHIFSKTCCFLCGRQRGNYLLSLYLFTKVLYLINAMCQLFLLNAMLDSGLRVFGVEALKALTQGNDWAITGLFPRVTMCNVKVRRLGNVHRYTVQCVLPVNLFNEKIYLFLWFWLVFIVVATVVSLLKWSLRAIITVDRHRYIKRHLTLAGIKPDSEERKVRMINFVDKYLQQDGVFLLHLVDHSTNTLTALDLTKALWDNYSGDNNSVAPPNHSAEEKF